MTNEEYDTLYIYVLLRIQHWARQAKLGEEQLLQQLLKAGDYDSGRCFTEIDVSDHMEKIRMENLKKMIEESRLLQEMREGREVFWLNPDKASFEESMDGCELTQKEVEEAEARLARFAPFIQNCFPETKEQKGLIESPLAEIEAMKAYINETYHAGLEGRLFLKEDSHLAIAGSVKARGGIYEILKHTEELALEKGLLKAGESYEKLGDPEIKAFFGDYTIQVGSTGNLGLSIGIISAVLGYRVIVHMSSDAKQWKKDLLRSYGVEVKEYEGDYGEAVKRGRALSESDEKSYFVDDESSRTLFLGYAVAGKRLLAQLKERKLSVDDAHPLFVYLPCGVGGAPGGISFGLKQIFQDHVHCFFAEPVQAPCMLLGMKTGLNHDISVQDIGLSGKTQADGLAVGRPSAFVGKIMKKMLSGEMTVQDEALFHFMKGLLDTEGIFLEPSACAGFQGPATIMCRPEMTEYLEKHHLKDKMKQAIHIVWATGGSLVPEEIRQEYIREEERMQKER